MHFLKLFCKTKNVQIKNNLTKQITTKCNKINHSPELLQHAKGEIKRKTEKCFQENDKYFQH